ncbi:MAG: polynucleotide kinase-phosphatase [Chamaesiphon sp.]|nr:polynucleotide kinase-phosphatase [Chamaesiphon sp.]
MKLNIPEFSLVVLIGASGSGKSSFARKHFLSTEIISSDYCRSIVSDDETNQAATTDAFELLHYIVAKRLKAGRLTVIDATNVKPEDRKPLLQLAKEYHCFAVTIVFNLPAQLCHDRNQTRENRNFGIHVVKRHTENLKRSLRHLDREFRYVHILSNVADITNVEIVRQPLWHNRKTEHGPFDIIGDIHGCCDELEILLAQLGYQAHLDPQDPCWDFPTYRHPTGRQVLFVGDLVDRGMRNLDSIKLARNMVAAGSALCVCGNHEFKLLRYLRGKDVKLNHGLELTVAEIEALPAPLQTEFRAELAKFIDSLISHYIFDDGKLVIAHAGLKEELQGRTSGQVRSFAMYGETTGEIDEYGLPVRANWAREYRGAATVVYGHVPVVEAEWLNNTIDIDTGCVFGGKLTALKYPEREIVQVPAARVYYEPMKPLEVDSIDRRSAQQEDDDILDVADVLGKRLINTRLQAQIAIQADRSIAALEVMSRFAANPKWLIYLPPTMSPVATSKLAGYLEYPTEAFDYYSKLGINRVVCEQKHMGSRAVVIICRDEAVVERRFGITGEGIGICYTRTGRRFFNETELETEFLGRIQAALTASDFWQRLETDWVCLDCELMPWSAKAQGLLRAQYAPVGAAANHGLEYATKLFQQALDRGVPVASQIERLQVRSSMAQKYVAAYRRYCWDVDSIEDFQLAPFHIMATEGVVHTDKDHIWHMNQIAKICKFDSILLATTHRTVNLQDEQAVTAAIQWWEALTQAGGEGMVVKSMPFIYAGSKGLIQPAVKCRGAEYLRIIYGAEYDLPEHLDRLRQRGLGAKRNLALREFSLGVEALERFVAKLPLRQVHECVFGVLALESEPIDPRL